MNITTIDKYEKTEQQFYDGAKNKHTKYKKLNMTAQNIRDHY